MIYIFFLKKQNPKQGVGGHSGPVTGRGWAGRPVAGLGPGRPGAQRLFPPGSAGHRGALSGLGAPAEGPVPYEDARVLCLLHLVPGEFRPLHAYQCWTVFLEAHYIKHFLGDFGNVILEDTSVEQRFSTVFSANTFCVISICNTSFSIPE